MVHVPSDRPTALLLACHDRMRTFGALAADIGRRTDAPADEVGEASRRLVRFFDLALPMHEADEEETLGRLLPLRLPHLADTLRVMEDQHRFLHELLEEIRPFWELLQHEPAAHPSQSWDLRSAARRFEAVLHVHLALEENVIFPAIDGLDDGFQDELRRELWARREAARR